MVKRLIIAALVALVLFLWLKREVSVSDFSPDITVYGSHGCPWCTKQEEHFKKNNFQYNFVDCKAGQCPEFVTSYPTTMFNGETYVGYTEKF
jgi:glutaredoxin